MVVRRAKVAGTSSPWHRRIIPTVTLVLLSGCSNGDGQGGTAAEGHAAAETANQAITSPPLEAPAAERPNPAVSSPPAPNPIVVEAPAESRGGPVDTAGVAAVGDMAADAENRQLLRDIAAGDAAAGEVYAETCLRCHSLAEGGANGVGPNLYGIVGAPVGGALGFDYSATMQALHDQGQTWTFERLDTFLENPAIAMPGTRMGFAGIRDAGDRVNLLAYLRLLANTPTSLAPQPFGATSGMSPLMIGEGQAANGILLYRQLGCDVCHGTGLTGVVDERVEAEGDGPPLIGQSFAERWFGGSVRDLYQVMQETMPPRNAGHLDDATGTALLAYILSVNGFAAGQDDLPADPNVLGGMGFFQ